MISDAAALVLFAIRSSIKLGLELRQAFGQHQTARSGVAVTELLQRAGHRVRD